MLGDPGQGLAETRALISAMAPFRGSNQAKLQDVNPELRAFTAASHRATAAALKQSRSGFSVYGAALLTMANRIEQQN